ncbi:MAG: long-chain fatty acid--CoA ligase [Myxococcales bacterium]|nr:long-chain fatty acid--CoA ligase [Myxococcales bacterium]
MSLNLAILLRDSATRFAGRKAIIIGNKSLSYEQLHQGVLAFAGALQEAHIPGGTNVALMLPNVPQFSIAYFGAQYAANPVVPLNVLLKSEEITYHLEDSKAEALVVWEGFYEQAKAGFDACESCKTMIVVGQGQETPSGVDGENILDFNTISTKAKPVTQLPATKADDTAVILYTSGTTGRPKGAELSHSNLVMNAQYFDNESPTGGEDLRAIVVLPLFHSFGQTVLQNTTFLRGGTLVLMPRFDAIAAANLIKEHKITMFAGVPTMYFGLLHHPEVRQEHLASVVHCVSGGAAMPVEVMNAFDKKFGVNILEGYGLSETSPIACFNSMDAEKKVGSIGRPIWGVEFMLLDNDGNEVTKAGERGEICIKGYNVMKGYFNRPEATAEAIVDGWFRSGDIGICDEDGYYFIVDRKKDMIIRGGYNVYPREIEEVLYGHEAVGEAAVIGVPHEQHGEEIKAVLTLKPGHELDADAVVAYCKERVAAYKYPRIVEFLDALPKGPTGKILKRELR